ncbi:hypothetical protein [Bradyrhizobium australiense]|uniref:Uncharacterized protein n=1 Tax=Bradyrhizobium australiense TaxID=2721161 RepID=A0A7Y4GWK2_9BRAD|nr:hypothetical protein [Bradyrhizobium australiense]NOJ43013.1 hypothetical protein [Bradyrhizobium australiense]
MTHVQAVWSTSHAPRKGGIGRNAGACLTERNGQQAGAQQHEAGRRQSKKSVGDDIVVAHETSTTSDARPNLLKLSESPIGTTEPFLFEARAATAAGLQTSRSGTIAFKRMGKENACAHQAHYRCHRLDHRTNPLRPCNAQNDCTVAQSKRFTGRSRRSVGSDDLMQQIV